MISGIITTGLLLLFVGGWVWLWNPRHKAVLDAAAHLPLEENETGTEQHPARPAKEVSP